MAHFALKIAAPSSAPNAIPDIIANTAIAVMKRFMDLSLLVRVFRNILIAGHHQRQFSLYRSGSNADCDRRHHGLAIWTDGPAAGASALDFPNSNIADKAGGHSTL
jgi:hypothetical protein